MKKIILSLIFGFIVSCEGDLVNVVPKPEGPSTIKPADPLNPAEPIVLDDFTLAPTNSILVPLFPQSSISLLASESLSVENESLLQDLAYSNNMIAVSSETKVYIYKRIEGNFILKQTINEAVNNLELLNNTLVLIVQNTIPNPTSNLVYGNSLMAKVYKLEGESFVEKAVLAALDPREGDIFGMDLKITEEYIVISTPFKDYPIDCSGEAASTVVCSASLDIMTDEGAIYVFDINNYQLLKTFWGAPGSSIGAKIVINDDEIAGMNLNCNKASSSKISNSFHSIERTYIPAIRAVGNCIYKMKFVANKVFFRPILEYKQSCAYFNIDIELSNFTNFNFDTDTNTFAYANSEKIFIYDFYSNKLFSLAKASSDIKNLIKKDDKLIFIEANRINIYDLL